MKNGNQDGCLRATNVWFSCSLLQEAEMMLKLAMFSRGWPILVFVLQRRRRRRGRQGRGRKEEERKEKNKEQKNSEEELKEKQGGRRDRSNGPRYRTRRRGQKLDMEELKEGGEEIWRIMNKGEFRRKGDERGSGQGRRIRFKRISKRWK